MRGDALGATGATPSIDPGFVADRHALMQSIGDGRLSPDERAQVHGVRNAVDAYQLGRQSGPIGGEVHRAAAADLDQSADRLTPSNRRVATAVLAYGAAHDAAAQRNWGGATAGGPQGGALQNAIYRPDQQPVAAALSAYGYEPQSTRIVPGATAPNQFARDQDRAHFAPTSPAPASRAKRPRHNNYRDGFSLRTDFMSSQQLEAYADEFNRNGGLRRAVGNSNDIVETYPDNDAVKRASAENAKIPPKLVTNFDPSWNQDEKLVSFLQSIREPLAKLEIGDREPYVTIGQNAAGEYGITSIQILADQGGRIRQIPGTIAIAHLHRRGSNQVPADADNSFTNETGRPAYVLGETRSTLFQVGRAPGDPDNAAYIRHVISPTSYGPWELFHSEADDYKTYSRSKFPE